ncbi:MAG TPA: hypothetical protein VFE07_16905, partial [Marmoricola sp.]|nr:hypothetical protein [Marmoricola sp.]
PTATFCLACDRPITDTERGLSVAEPVLVPQRARPVLAILAIAAVVAVLGGTTYGVLHFVSGRHHNAEASAATDARDAMTLLVRAEGGDSHACGRVGAFIAGGTARHDCLAIVDHDRGATLADVRTAPAKLVGTAGTVRVTATVTDRRGTRHLDEVVDLAELGKLWRVRWDGEPPV